MLKLSHSAAKLQSEKHITHVTTITIPILIKAFFAININ